MYKIISQKEEDTIEFASRLASKLKQKDLIWLSGDLGAGKTKFVQGVLRYFGIEDQISSPTFTIVNEYEKGEIKIYHFDVYRLADEEEFFAIGGEEYFEKGICFIEWGEMIQSALPKSYLKITFDKIEENFEKRILRIEPVGEIRKEVITFLEEQNHENISN